MKAKQEEDTMSQQPDLGLLEPYSDLNPAKRLLILMKDSWSRSHPLVLWNNCSLWMIVQTYGLSTACLLCRNECQGTHPEGI